MRVRVRAVRAATGVLVAAAILAATATTAAAAEDEGELVDVTKTVSSLEKKMSELRQRGQQARKGELSASAVCGDAQAEQVFADWGDPSLYVPAAGGDAESLDEWSLNKNAGRGNNSPFSRGSSSLFLGEKGEAISPAMCVSVAHPTIRLFALNTADEDSELEVEVYYEGLDGKVKKLKIARLRGGAQWSPTTIVPLYVNMLGAAADDGFTAIAVKFKAKGVKQKGTGWLIDDLYVDPLKTW
jgi:hypothetical protein